MELVDACGPQQIIRTVQRMSDEARARVAVSAVHMAKGREWNRVRIGAGFTPPDEGSPCTVRPAAARLIYFAVSSEVMIHVASIDGLAKRITDEITPTWRGTY